MLLSPCLSTYLSVSAPAPARRRGPLHIHRLHGCSSAHESDCLPAKQRHERVCVVPEIVRVPHARRTTRPSPTASRACSHSSLASSLCPFLDASRTVTIRAWPPFNTHRGPFHFWHTSVHSHLVTYEVLSHRDSTRVAAQGARVTHPWPPRSAHVPRMGGNLAAHDGGLSFLGSPPHN